MTFKRNFLLHKVFFFAAIFFALCRVSFAQNGRPDFQDSIQFTLENTKLVGAIAIGAAFHSLWDSFSSDQQNKIKEQVFALRKKGFPFPHFLHYYSCINSAGSNLNSFLETASHVIAGEDLKAVELFCLNSRTFLEKHALNFTVPFKVLTDAAFTFAYVERKVRSDTVAVDYSTDTTANAMDAPVKIPPHEGAVIRFDNPTSLRFVTGHDSTTLTETKGTFSLIDKSFHGSGGRFDWSSAGISADSTYYIFADFSYNTASPVLKARGGTLFTEKSPTPIPGVFEFNALPGSTEIGSYPRFTSYANNLQINGLPPSVKYTGGFALRGHYLRNYSMKGGLGQLEWSENEGRKLVARGKSFQFSQDKGVIEGNDMAVSIYHDGDSITHPSKAFKLDYNNHKLFLLPSRSKMRKSPYVSSLFGVGFNADELVWDTKTDQIRLSVLGSGKVSPLIFESNRYYSPDNIRLLQGHGFRFHPLLLVTRYAKTTGQRNIYVSELVPGSGSSYEAVQMAMELLAEKGIVLYNPYLSRVTVTDKAMLWLEAYNKKADYDNLKIQSYYDSGANAIMDLKAKTITVHGVDEFTVSDSLDVRVRPDSSTLQITPNRGFTYNGILQSGIFEIHGKDFNFDYGTYSVNMKRIDSIRLRIQRKGSVYERVNHPLISIGNNVVNNPEAIKKALLDASRFTSGVLYVNRPDNKAGLKKADSYPRLESKGSAVIYFDKREVLNGAYDRSVYFFVPPFTIDSLEKSNTGSARFKGKFMTSGMLPDFDEVLHTMTDRSLGFLHTIPGTGYQLYTGKGLLFGNLSLNNKGLRNKGRLQFLTTTLNSDDFILYPDSLTSLGSSGEVKEGTVGGVGFPGITFKKYQLKWLPKEDQMHIFSTTEPFELYKGLGSLNGGITVSEKMVTGKGRMKLPGCEIASKLYDFFTGKINAQDARFKVFTENSKVPAMDAKHVILEFDLAGEKAKIRPQVVGNRAFEFPLMQFKTSISTAEWDLKAMKITMKAEGDLAHSSFVSTKPELDSLSFSAEKAEYDIKTETLTLSGVPYITVADMRITPENKSFVVRKKTRFGLFKNVTIVADTAHQYHKLVDGQVEIVSRNKLKGSATYHYGNIAGDTFKIKMSEFELVPLDNMRKVRKGTKMQTSAKGEIPESMNLRMSPHMLFKGTATMYAAYPKLSLAGYICPEIKSETKKTWIKYTQTGKEFNEYIPFDKAITEDGQKPLAGLYFAQDGSPYPLFIAEKRELTDLPFFQPSGVLYFDEKASLFKIEDTLKASGENLSGQLFSYNDSTLNATFDGRLEFMPDYPNLKFIASGIGKYTHSSHEVSMNALLMLDGKLNNSAMQLMADRLKQMAKEINADTGHGDHTQLLYKMGSLLPEKVIKDFEKESQQADIPLFSVPLFLKSLVISNFDMLYSDKHKAFYSTGMIGISNIGKTNIDAEFEGYIEVRHTGPLTVEMHIFIKAAGDAWYYFGLVENKLLMYSSDEAFNSAVAKKANVPKDGEIAFMPGLENDVVDFLNRFYKNYLGIERPYALADDMVVLKSLVRKEISAENLSGTPAGKRKEDAKDRTKDKTKDKETVAQSQPKEKKSNKKKEKKPGPAEDTVVKKPAPNDSTQTKPAKAHKPEKKEDDGF